MKSIFCNYQSNGNLMKKVLITGITGQDVSSLAEVPTGCNYRGLKRTSTQGPFKTGVEVVISIVRLVVDDKPLICLGLPRMISLCLGLLLGAWLPRFYAIDQQIVTCMALAVISFILIGMFCTFTNIAKLKQKISHIE